MLPVNRCFHRIDHKVPLGQLSFDDARLEQIEGLIPPGPGKPVKKENIDVAREEFPNGEHAPRLVPVYNVG